MGGKIHVPLGGWYHATKFAVEGFSDALRIEVAPYGIQVSVIEPGAINTEWHRVAAENLLATSGVGAYADQGPPGAAAPPARPRRRGPRPQADPAGPSSVAGQGVRPHCAADLPARQPHRR